MYCFNLRLVDPPIPLISSGFNMSPGQIYRHISLSTAHQENELKLISAKQWTTNHKKQSGVVYEDMLQFAS